MSLLVLFVIFASFSVVKGTSQPDPAIIDLCDAYSPRFGCDPSKWQVVNNAANRLNCTTKGQVMAWASKTVVNSCYTIIAGTESKPVSTYTPGQLVNMQIRVSCYNMVYRGILMYAVDSNEKRVGSWDHTGGDSGDFMTPFTSGPCVGSLMHSTAEFKPYLSTVSFRAPVAGTGKITFRVLIKYGDANEGAFYWPSNNVSLSEGPAVTISSTFFALGDAGKSCDEVCKGTAGYSCDDSLLRNTATFGVQVTKNTACTLPLLSGCGKDAATYDPADQFCYYPASDCSQTNRTIITTNCFSKFSGVQRFCGCTSSAVTPGNTGASSASSDSSSDMSSSSTSRVGSLSAILALAMFFVSPRTAGVFLLCLGLVSGHNWVASQSRSTSASTFGPFKPPTSVYPHVQVGPGQKFTIEWACAHYGYTYFAVVKLENSGNCTLITEKLLDDYLKNAPNSSKLEAGKGYWQKFHRNAANSTASERDGVPNFYKRIVPVNDPLFIHRDPALRGGVGSVGNPNDFNTFQLQYNDSDVANDLRVSYNSAKYPWLEAVHKFEHISFQAVYHDFAQFTLPAYGGPGRYIIQYLWNGYRDAIDVDVMEDQVTDIYGVPANASAWKRIDHCIYPEAVQVYDFSEVVTDVQWCLRRCTANQNCEGVNVVPIMAPSSAYKFNKPTGATFYHPEIFGSDFYVPWTAPKMYGQTSIFINNTEVDRLLANPSPTKFMCYTLAPRLPSSTRDTFALTKDPEDPIFYSSCYYPYKGNVFPGYPPITYTPTTTKGDWRFNDRCVSCYDQAYNAQNVIPVWNVSTKCVDCEREPAVANPPAPVDMVPVEAGFACDGAGGNWRFPSHHSCPSNNTCVIRMYPAGRIVPDLRNSDTYVDECRELTARNPNCSNTYYWTDRLTAYAPTACYCYAKATCCNECSRVGVGSTTVYNVKAVPDPTCANGVLSSDKSFCCSASCGAGNCKPGTSAAVAATGFCISNSPTITRTCSTAGAPCKM